MFVECLDSLEELFDLSFDANDFVVGFRDRYGDHEVAATEEDPDMVEYQEMMDLGASLSSLRD